ncbi:NADH-quinone oxidoreductase subunit B, partial [Candidatus Latescibacterota bacterium]
MSPIVHTVLSWARRHSLRPLAFGTSCCAQELRAALGSSYDLGRAGCGAPAVSPRQADVLIVAGRISMKLAPALRQSYDEMLEPKWVVALGACASSGGVFGTYAVVQGIDSIVPVDVYVPGCPPAPADVIDGLGLLQQRLGKTRR